MVTKYIIEEPSAGTTASRYSIEAPTSTTTLSGLAGSVGRGLAPIALGVGIGAASGAPFGGIGAVPGALAGGGAVALTQLATALYRPLAEQFGWPKIATPKEMTDRVLDAVGIAKPSTPTERVAEAISGGAASAVGSIGLARLVSQAASPVVKGIAGKLAARPVLQTASGAAGAAAGQITAEEGGNPYEQLAASILGGSLVGTPSGIRSAATSKTSEEIDAAVLRLYQRGIKPTVVGKSKVSTYNQAAIKMRQAVDSIVSDRNNLHLTDEYGDPVKNNLPKTVAQMMQAVEQREERVFTAYNTLAHAAGQKGAIVDLASIGQELRKVAADPVMQTHHPALVEYANGAADRLEARGTHSAEDAQRAIASYNHKLESFYKNPSYADASTAHVDSLIANQLRQQLDNVITSTEGPGYQALKSEWGALRSIEKEVVHRATVENRKQLGGGIIGNIADVASAHDVIRGVIFLDPSSFASGTALHGIRRYWNWLRGPNQAVSTLFKVAERRVAPPPLPPPGWGFMPGVIGGAAVVPPPSSSALGLQ